MGFEALEVIGKHNQPPTAKITYLRGTRAAKPGQAQKSNEGVKPKLKISIPTTLCGTAKAKTFELLLGSGSDLGKIRISGCKAGNDKGIAPHELMHAFVFSFGYVPKLGDDIFDERMPVRKITDDVFEIDVPASWFKPQSGVGSKVS